MRLRCRRRMLQYSEVHAQFIGRSPDYADSARNTHCDNHHYAESERDTHCDADPASSA
jgi:hypothetical protein